MIPLFSLNNINLIVIARDINEEDRVLLTKYNIPIYENIDKDNAFKINDALDNAFESYSTRLAGLNSIKDAMVKHNLTIESLNSSPNVARLGIINSEQLDNMISTLNIILEPANWNKLIQHTI